MMTVTIRLFARARDLAGADFVALDLPDAATVANLRQRLAERVPALVVLLPRCAVAVNEEVADDSTAVQPGSDVALLPPVSGG